MRRGVEQRHPGAVGRLDRSDGPAFVEPLVQVPEGRSAEAENGDRDVCLSEGAGGKHGNASVA